MGVSSYQLIGIQPQFPITFNGAIAITASRQWPVRWPQASANRAAPLANWNCKVKKRKDCSGLVTKEKSLGNGHVNLDKVPTMTTQHDLLPGVPKQSVARKTTAKSTSPASPALQACQLYVELEWVQPKVWRRLLVPATIRLSRLHDVLQEGMGWEDEHLHEFVFADTRYCLSQRGREMREIRLDESSFTLQEALGGRKAFKYVYDFGDGWRHKIKVEKIITLNEPPSQAVCLDGENACPPEDVGGPPGYEEFLQALADPAHPDHEDLKEWSGGPFDPAAFDLAEVNARLKRVAA